MLFMPLFHISLGWSFATVSGCHGSGDSVVALPTFMGLHGRYPRTSGSGHRCCSEGDTLLGQEHSELSQDLCTDTRNGPLLHGVC